MADTTTGLFGMTPESYQMAQDQAAQAQALQFAKLDPFEKASYGMALAGNRLGGALGQALGAEDPMLKQVSMQQSILKNINPNDLNSLAAGIKSAQEAGLPQLAMALTGKLQEYRTALAEQAQKAAAANKNVFDISAQGKGLQLAATGKYDADSIAKATNADGTIDFSKLVPLDKTSKPTSEFLQAARGLGLKANDSYNEYTSDEVAKVNQAILADRLKEKAAGAISVRIPLNDALERVYLEGDRKEASKNWALAGEAYKEGNSTLNLLDTFKQTAQTGFTGAGSDAKLVLSKALGTVGVNIGTKATDTEISNALSSQLVQKIAKVFPGSQSNKELGELLKSKPNMQQELPTILRLIDRMQLELGAKQKTYEQIANLPDKERAKANPNLIEVDIYNKMKRLRELEAKAGGQ